MAAVGRELPVKLVITRGKRADLLIWQSEGASYTNVMSLVLIITVGNDFDHKLIGHKGATFPNLAN